jgi:DNA polymerase-3 subunit epsilon
LRLRTQINQEGLPSNCINPNKLTSMEKHQLKEALNLEKCRHRYNLPDYSNHNALTDAMATAELLLAQINHISSGKPLAVKSLL